MGYQLSTQILNPPPGVDVAADIFDDDAIKTLLSNKPRSIICTHMFEHIEDRNELAKRLMGLLPEGGMFFVTVPYSYHHHADPIDTMYQPSPDELAGHVSRPRNT